MSATAQELVQFVRGLRQVREFTPEPVSEEALHDILEIGRWSGSGGNKQPAEVVVVRHRDLNRKLREWGANPAGDAAATFVIASRNERPGVDEGRLAERLMLGAHALGLGAAIATLKESGPSEAKKALGVPDHLYTQVVVTIGHIDRVARRGREKRPGPPRKPMAEFAHWDRY
ncbi:MAG TPA: nitroreductase family protein [Chloroflexota bacterium]